MSVCGDGQSELTELLSGCTAAEQQFLLEVLNAVKNCIIFSRELEKSARQKTVWHLNLQTDLAAAFA